MIDENTAPSFFRFAMAFTSNHRFNIPPYLELQRMDHGDFTVILYAVLEGPPYNPYYTILLVIKTQEAGGPDQMFNGPNGWNGNDGNGQDGLAM